MIRLPLFAAALVLLSACEALESPTPIARGDAEEIVVATDSATWAGPVGEAIRETVGRRIATLPSNQGAFKFRRVPLTGQTLSTLQMTPAVMVVGDIDSPGDLGDFIRSRVGEGNLASVRAGDAAAVNVRENLWAQNQLVTIATAADDRALALRLLDAGDGLRDRYDALARLRTAEDMFGRLRQEDVEADLLDRHGFTLGVQADYVLVQDTTATAAGRTGTFVRFRRVLSDTWRDFFVFVEEGVSEVPPPAEVDAITDDLLRQFAQGSIDSSYVQIEKSRPQTNATAEIDGQAAQEQRGFWQTTLVPMGGSYVRYAWVDPATDRLYLYYGMTFAPSRRLDKRKFLRQMETIAYSFRTE